MDNFDPDLNFDEEFGKYIDVIISEAERARTGGCCSVGVGDAYLDVGMQGNVIVLYIDKACGRHDGSKMPESLRDMIANELNARHFEFVMM